MLGNKIFRFSEIFQIFTIFFIFSEIVQIFGNFSDFWKLVNFSEILSYFRENFKFSKKFHIFGIFSVTKTFPDSTFSTDSATSITFSNNSASFDLSNWVT